MRASRLEARNARGFRLSHVAMVLLGLAAVYYGVLTSALGLIPGSIALAWVAAAWWFETRQRSERAWVFPFLWVLIVPAVTVAAQIALLGPITGGYEYRGVFAGGAAGACEQVAQSSYDKQWDCPAAVALPTLLPGLLNLAPLIGLLSPTGLVRWASVVAAALGLLRLLVPLAIYAADGADVTIIGSWQFPAAMGSFASAYASIALWFASLAAMALFGVWPRGAAQPVRAS